MELKYIVYITINQCNGKFYIGVHETNPDVFDGYIGCGIYRESDAKRAKKANNPFANAVVKYGYQNFKRTTLRVFPYTDEGQELAYDLEAALVTPTVLKSKTCYNNKTGGFEGGAIPSRPVYQYDQRGNYLRSYMSCKEAAVDLKAENIISAIKSIRKCCLGKSNTALGFVWSYCKKFQPVEVRKICQYTLSGKFLRTFNSVKEAENLLNIRGIHYALCKKNPRQQIGGYRWRYYQDNTDNLPPLTSIRFEAFVKPIDMYDLSGNFLEHFESIHKCKVKYPQFRACQITKVVKGKIKSTGGYIFKYSKVDDIV